MSITRIACGRCGFPLAHCTCTPAIDNELENEMVLSDQYIESLFQGANFGSLINNSVEEKRKLIIKTLHNQVEGFWSGHTAYHIVVDGGFLHDAKPGEEKRLTALGAAFLQDAGVLVQSCK